MTKKSTKLTLLLTGFLILGVTLTMGASAFARGGMGWGMHGGKKMKRWMLMKLTPEQAGQVFDLRQKFMNDTVKLRKNMMVKRVELAQLWKTDKPDEKAILAKVKELGALKAQFMEKAVAQRLEMRKIAPEAMSSCPMFGPGFGPGGPGPGKGKGRGAGKGARFIPGSKNMAGYEGDPDLELTLNQESFWPSGF
jgi:Spy/CpxP family protein refolding chaperone